VCWSLAALASFGLVRLDAADCQGPLALDDTPGPVAATWPVVSSASAPRDESNRERSRDDPGITTLSALGPFRLRSESPPSRSDSGESRAQLTDTEACGRGTLPVALPAARNPWSLALHEGPSPGLFALSYEQEEHRLAQAFRRRSSTLRDRVIGRRWGALLVLVDALLIVAGVGLNVAAFRRQELPPRAS
jgi:hypothetical protein